MSINDFYLLVVIVKQASSLSSHPIWSPCFLIPPPLQFSHDIFSDHFVHRHAFLLSTSLTLPVFTLVPDELL